MDGKLIGLVRDTLVRQYGEDMWVALADQTPEAEGAPSDALACWLGQHTVPALLDIYPSLFSRHDDLASFIRGLGDDLPMVSDRDAADSTPLSFRTTISPDDQILLRIEAHCAICALIQGVIAGAAVHYDERVAIKQLKSRRHGDNVCLLEIEIGEPADVRDNDVLDFVAVGNA
ncbi:MAG: heme NO-binding domain-containing protein [Gemmatimonadota bacterium]|nr:heme NO-binding domain-containing protein [Gemmatimonadota bacterium]